MIWGMLSSVMLPWAVTVESRLKPNFLVKLSCVHNTHINHTTLYIFAENVSVWRCLWASWWSVAPARCPSTTGSPRSTTRWWFISASFGIPYLIGCFRLPKNHSWVRGERELRLHPYSAGLLQFQGEMIQIQMQINANFWRQSKVSGIRETMPSSQNAGRGWGKRQHLCHLDTPAGWFVKLISKMQSIVTAGATLRSGALETHRAGCSVRQRSQVLSAWLSGGSMTELLPLQQLQSSRTAGLFHHTVTFRHNTTITGWKK